MSFCKVLHVIIANFLSFFFLEIIILCSRLSTFPFFLSGSYVLVITSQRDAGSYQGSPVYNVNSMKFLCCNEAIKHLTAQEV